MHTIQTWLGSVRERLEKRWALEGCASKLPKELRRRHGRKNFYASEEVIEAIEVTGFDARYTQYALAAFATRSACQAAGIDPNLRTQMRSEVADRLFGDPADFSTRDLFDLASPASSADIGGASHGSDMDGGSMEADGDSD